MTVAEVPETEAGAVTADGPTPESAPPAPPPPKASPRWNPVVTKTPQRLPAPKVNVSEAELYAKIKAAFDEIDADGSGACSAEEIFVAVDDLGLGIPPEQLAQMIKDADEDESGEIEFAEFMSLMRRVLYGEDGQAREVKKTSKKSALTDLQTGFNWGSLFSWFGGGGGDSQGGGVLDNMFGGKSSQQQETEGGQVTRGDLDEQSRASSPTRSLRTPLRTPKADCHNPGYKQPSALRSGRNTPPLKFNNTSEAKLFFKAPPVQRAKNAITPPKTVLFHAAQPGVWNGTSHSSPTGNYKSGVSLVSRGAGALSRAMRPGGGARTPPTPPSPGIGTPPTGNGH